MEIPDFIRQYLWDVKDVGVEEHKSFVVERVLEYGGDRALKWLREIYSEEDIATALKKSRTISAKTANYYAKLFGVRAEEVECLNKPFTRKQDRF